MGMHSLEQIFCSFGVNKPIYIHIYISEVIYIYNMTLETNKNADSMKAGISGELYFSTARPINIYYIIELNGYIGE